MGRGPSYPYVGLEEAIALARKVYDHAKRGPAPIDSLITEGFKYTSTSSSGAKVLAALRAFELIEDAPGANGKAVRLTPRSVRILLDDPESAERKDEIKTAALAPKWYEYCWNKWGADMPPAMKHNLLVEHGFVESTVDGFLKDYRTTMAFAGLLDDKLFGKSEKSAIQSKSQFQIGDYVQWETQGCLRLPSARRITAFLDGGKFATVEGSSNPIPVAELIPADPPEEPLVHAPDISIPAIKPSSQEGTKMQTDVIAIGGNSITLQIQWPTEITQDAYDDLVDYLDLLKKRAKRAIKPSQQYEPKQVLPSHDEGG